MDRNVKYLIIGAGISGLTFANYADGDYLIIEKEKDGRSGRRKPVYAVWKEQCKSICAVYDGYYV